MPTAKWQRLNEGRRCERARKSGKRPNGGLTEKTPAITVSVLWEVFSRISRSSHVRQNAGTLTRVLANAATDLERPFSVLAEKTWRDLVADGALLIRRPFRRHGHFRPRPEELGP
jgi:hypothetical protein